MPKIKRETIKKRRLKELHTIFSGIDVDKAALVQPLIESAATMETILTDLRFTLETFGIEEEYKNGPDQFCTKESTASRVFSAMIKNYNAVIRTLLTCLPEDKQKDAADQLDDFLNPQK
jgi:hypothetical protein